MNDIKKTLNALLVSVCTATLAHGSDRLPKIPPAEYTPEQRQAASEFEAARHAPLFGPFEPMMHSPQAMSLARAMGDYFRYQSAIGNPLSELAILMTARAWSQDFEWSVHAPIAIKAGLKASVVDAIALARRPPSLSADEQCIYDFVSQLLSDKQVSDAAFDRVKTRFGAKGAVDLSGIVGYYTFLAMQLNAAEYSSGPDGPRLPRLRR